MKRDERYKQIQNRGEIGRLLDGNDGMSVEFAGGSSARAEVPRLPTPGSKYPGEGDSYPFKAIRHRAGAAGLLTAMINEVKAISRAKQKIAGKQCCERRVQKLQQSLDLWLHYGAVLKSLGPVCNADGEVVDLAAAFAVLGQELLSLGRAQDRLYLKSLLGIAHDRIAQPQREARAGKSRRAEQQKQSARAICSRLIRETPHLEKDEYRGALLDHIRDGLFAEMRKEEGVKAAKPCRRTIRRYLEGFHPPKPKTT